MKNENFVTLFDKKFLPQGLALYYSMIKHIKNFTLWIVCIDQLVYDRLNLLNLSNVKLLNLNDLETKELLSIKNRRTRTEYCWTLTPFTPRFVFDSDSSVKQVTYIDADIWFRKSPSKIFVEFEQSKKDVLITDHSYSPEYDQSASSGQFCVQFMIFKKNKGSELVRKNWEDNCLEWCYNKQENGKFGDQKYLEDWPISFSRNVHILQDKELALAPWNILRFPYGNSIFFHFHGLRIINSKKIFLGNYKIPKPVIENIYKPYLEDLSLVIYKLKNNNFNIFPQTKYNSTLFYLIVGLRRLILDFLNFHKISRVHKL
jgi:hypothetical protein